VLVAPMAVPTLIFGVEAANAASVAPFPAMIAALAGISLAAVALAPFAAAAALRAARG
ncbi:MAG: heme exporter protein CcmB, partial [Hyphomicrobiales bacterium]|nr:heme exporter protein CcmB [Hyphomicrobiales bacterium]